MPDKTATEVMQDRDAWRDERIVHDYMNHFCKRWAPSDQRENAEFQADFLSVVQAIHRDAARPMHDALTKAFAAMSPMIFPSPENAPPTKKAG
jgi:hypothetical protein